MDLKKLTRGMPSRESVWDGMRSISEMVDKVEDHEKRLKTLEEKIRLLVEAGNR